MSGVIVTQKEYPAPEYDRREIMLYMGMSGANIKEAEVHSVESLLDECLAQCEAESTFVYKVCYCILPVEITDETVSAEGIVFNSRSLARHLRDCRQIVVFAATVGIGIDRLIGKYSVFSPSKALAFQSIGAERIESLCDAFCGDMNSFFSSENHHLKSRFSPGYGDLAIEAQKDIFRLLDCSKRIGVSLCDSMLMSPSKSVTAIIGIY